MQTEDHVTPGGSILDRFFSSTPGKSKTARNLYAWAQSGEAELAYVVGEILRITRWTWGDLALVLGRIGRRNPPYDSSIARWLRGAQRPRGWWPVLLKLLDDIARQKPPELLIPLAREIDRLGGVRRKTLRRSAGRIQVQYWPWPGHCLPDTDIRVPWKLRDWLKTRRRVAFRRPWRGLQG